MDEKILEQLRLLKLYIRYLKEISKLEKDKFVDDFLLKGGAERYLQLAIECCINIGNRLLSVIQITTPVKVPETYADIFREMALLGIIPKDFLDTILNMVRFRNRIVHMYWDIDPAQLYDILQQHLIDFEVFMKHVIDYLNKEKL
jgi:uncharacterized protein YutE (UPF0331/DUF86 family)